MRSLCFFSTDDGIITGALELEILLGKSMDLYSWSPVMNQRKKEKIRWSYSLLI